MSGIRKLVVALVGLVLMVLNDYFGVTALAGLEEPIANTILALLTAFGIYQVPNTP